MVVCRAIIYAIKISFAALCASAVNLHYGRVLKADIDNAL
jgi:hypothetical protein